LLTALLSPLYASQPTKQTDGGIAKLVTCLADRSAVTPRIRLNTKVKSFAISAGKSVTVRTTRSTYTFNYVINTLPVGVMQRYLDTLFPAASLWPPAKKAALMQFRMATYTKVCSCCWGSGMWYWEGSLSGVWVSQKCEVVS